MGIHDGHRERLRTRFAEHGLDNFDDHSVLELLLFFSIPRGDVNPLAHRLIDHFGSLDAVFDAPEKELLAVPGVGKRTVELLKTVPQVARRYLISRAEFGDMLNSSSKAGKYILPRFFGEQEEVVYLICLDAKCKVLACRLIARGSVNSANISVRKICETALNCNATSVILAHNHTSGIPIPSKEDELTTSHICKALAALDISVADHIVVANDDFVSMSDNGFFRQR